MKFKNVMMLIIKENIVSKKCRYIIYSDLSTFNHLPKHFLVNKIVKNSLLFNFIEINDSNNEESMLVKL